MRRPPICYDQGLFQVFTMDDAAEKKLLDAIRAGEEAAFERLYDLYHARVRLTAWRITHRADWLDDLLNEAWCRAFDQRRAYNPKWPFLVWMAGILRNVYREHCRQSPMTLTADDVRLAGGAETEDLDPQSLADAAEALAALNDCLSRLGAEDARIVQLRYFEGKSLRFVANEVRIAESTLRDSRVPAILATLRRCLAKKKIEIPAFFSAHGEGESQ